MVGSSVLATYTSLSLPIDHFGSRYSGSFSFYPIFRMTTWEVIKKGAGCHSAPFCLRPVAGNLAPSFIRAGPIIIFQPLYRSDSDIFSTAQRSEDQERKHRADIFGHDHCLHSSTFDTTVCLVVIDYPHFLPNIHW